MEHSQTQITKPLINIQNYTNTDAVKIITVIQGFIYQNRDINKMELIFNHIYHNLCSFSESVSSCDLMLHSFTKEYIIILIKQGQTHYCCKYQFNDECFECQPSVSQMMLVNPRNSIHALNTTLSSQQFTPISKQIILPAYGVNSYGLITEQDSKQTFDILRLTDFVSINYYDI